MVVIKTVTCDITYAECIEITFIDEVCVISNVEILLSFFVHQFVYTKQKSVSFT